MNHFGVRVISVALLSALIAVPADAQWWNPNDSIGPGKRGTIAEPKVVYDSKLYEQAKSASNAFIFNDKFAELERMHDEFMRVKARSTDGRFMVQAIQDNVAGIGGTMDERMALNIFKTWEAKVPESKLRPVLLAVLHQAQAWKARGTSFGTTPEGVQLFRERLLLAAKTLEDNATAGKESPIWWWVALIVAGSSGRSPEEMDAIFEEAVARFPSYQTLYFTRVNYLLPRWGGSEEAVDRFVTASIDRTKAAEGQSMYLWLYMDLTAKNCCGNENLPKVWPRLKSAFEELITRYPDVRTKNQYGAYACRARDKETTARMLTELGNEASFFGVRSLTTDTCRRLAFPVA